MTLGAAVYVNRMRNMIQFTRSRPSRTTHPLVSRIGTSRASGIVASSSQSTDVLTKTVTAFANYSWQDDPKPTGFDVAELNLQPAQRFNAGVGFTGVRYLGNLSGSFVDRAFWQDVDPRYVGFTDAYSTIDGGLGVRSTDGTMTVAVRGKNLFNKTVREHVFGDLIKRAVTGEVIFRF